MMAGRRRRQKRGMQGGGHDGNGPGAQDAFKTSPELGQGTAVVTAGQPHQQFEQYQQQPYQQPYPYQQYHDQQQQQAAYRFWPSAPWSQVRVSPSLACLPG